MFDRLRSLPVPARPSCSAVDRRHGARRLGLFVTVCVGFLTGFRFHGSALDAVAAVALCLLFGAAFSWPFIYMGLVAGNAQAANGMAFLAFPLVFVSSAYVPVESMPGWMQPVAENQPVTMMVGAVRALSLGDQADAVLAHSAGWYSVRAIVWSLAIVAVFAPLATRASPGAERETSGMRHRRRRASFLNRWIGMAGAASRLN